jgi:hypothetical protein
MRSPFKNTFYKTFQEIFETSIVAQNPDTNKFRSLLNSLLNEKSPNAIIELLKLHDVYALDISMNPVPVWAFFENGFDRSSAKKIENVPACCNFVQGDDLTHIIYQLSSDFGVSPKRIGVSTTISNIPKGAMPPWVRKAGPLWNILVVGQPKRPPIEIYHDSLRKIRDLI